MAHEELYRSSRGEFASVSSLSQPVLRRLAAVRRRSARLLLLPPPGATAAFLHDCHELFKLRVVALVLFTAWGGFYLASLAAGRSSLERALFDALLGIGLLSAGAGALNEVFERGADARMHRTATRPLASGRLSPRLGLVAGLGAIALGALWLGFTSNCLTLELGLFAVFTYVAVYTPLKRVTALATFVGALPGAMGPLLGWTAARGRLDPPAWALFALLFVWQFPHFLSIAWLYREESNRAGLCSLPGSDPSGWTTAATALVSAALLLPVSLLPWRMGLAGPIYVAFALLLGLLYLAYTLRFAAILTVADELESRLLARDLLKASVLYLPLVFAALICCAVVAPALSGVR